MPVRPPTKRRSAASPGGCGYPDERRRIQVRKDSCDHIRRLIDSGDGQQQGLAALIVGVRRLVAHSGNGHSNPSPPGATPEQRLYVVDRLDPPRRDGARFRTQEPVAQPNPVGGLCNGEAVVPNEFRQDDDERNTAGDEGHPDAAPAFGHVADGDDHNGDEQ